MTPFPLNTFRDLYMSSYNLNRRFRPNYWPETTQCLNFYREEVKEMLDALDTDSPEHFCEELADVMVTAMLCLMVMDIKAEPIFGWIQHDWNGNPSIRSYTPVTPVVVDRVEALMHFQACDSNFQKAITFNNTDQTRRGFVMLVLAAVNLIMGRGIAIQLWVDAMNFVVQKNDSKTEHTHFLNLITGKITRRQS